MSTPREQSPPRQTSTRLSEEQAEHVESVRLFIGGEATTSDAVRRIVDEHRAVVLQRARAAREEQERVTVTYRVSPCTCPACQELARG